MATDPAAIQQLCRQSGLSESDAALLLGETGGDLNLAMMLVQRTMQVSQAKPQSTHPAVRELQKAIDACSGSAAAVQELASSMGAFAQGDVPRAVARAQAAHHPLWQASLPHPPPPPSPGEGGPSPHQPSPLLTAIDRWIQFLRGDTESESLRYQRSQRAPAIALNVAAPPAAAPSSSPPADLRDFLLAERVCSPAHLEALSRTRDLEDLLINQGHIEGRSIVALLERYYGMPYFSWCLHPWDPTLVEAFGLEKAQRMGQAPVSRQSGRIVVGLLAPGNLQGLGGMRRHFAPSEILPVILRRTDLEAMLQFCRDVPA